MEGMSVQWSFKNKKLIFQTRTNTLGWVAIGINEEEELVGSNLITLSINEGQPIISDRYILGHGNHKAIEELDGQSHVTLNHSKKSANSVWFEFEVICSPTDPYHFQLRKGKTIYLTMAYSISPDFQHHSLKREIRKIIL